MNINGTGNRIYATVRQLASNPNFNLYECLEGKQTYFLKIAKSKAENGTLEKEEYILKTLKEVSDNVEIKYAKERTRPDSVLNNHFFFPEVVDSFICKEQQNRRVLILGFTSVSKQTSDLAPISFITKRDMVRIDPKTSVWVLGKLLKMLVFTHDQNVLIRDLSADNILVNKAQHYVSVLNWGDALILNRELEQKECSIEIVGVTREVIKLLGGNPKTGEIPADEQMEDSRYQDLLKKLILGEYYDAYLAHSDFYGIVRSIWPSKFHPYTTK